ncbi:S1 family peptidase [Corynebacterium breve]|uniref:S1 family peptidase n=1 Tax=Corynebacterium breve TaxID=3049799 RepID=A0ABY8VFP9_9CORY|nr:S1 family peptidase [Corynebacterium breve]WIM68323.1 S1 family peptidase [Corynebacterium breve]
MLRRTTLRTLAISATLCLVTAASPIASAQSSAGLPFELPELPELSVTPMDSSSYVEQARDDAAQFGIEIPQVDAAVTDSIDQAVNQFLPQEPVTVEEIVAPVEAPEEVAAESYSMTNPEPVGMDTVPEPLPVTTNQNYVWRNDPVSKVMAGKPFEENVLHRVDGSWFDAPRVPEESNQAMSRGNSLYGPSTPIYVGEDTMCTLTVAGTDEQGRKIGITAGHCGEVGDSVSSADSWQVGPSGTVVHRNDYLDYSVIEFGSNAEVTNTYNGVTVNSVGGEPQPGERVCKKGVASNETCGVTFVTSKDLQINHVCSMVGDSGAPLYRDGRLVGMVNGGVLPTPFNVQCVTPLQGALHAPTAGARMDSVISDMNNSGAPGKGFVVASQ